MIVHNGIKISQLRDSLQNIPTRIIERVETDENDQNVIKLPCSTLEIFDMFEQRLQTDITYRNKIVSFNKIFFKENKKYLKKIKKSMFF